MTTHINVPESAKDQMYEEIYGVARNGQEFTVEMAKSYAEFGKNGQLMMYAQLLCQPV